MLKIRNANGQPGHRKYAGEVPMKYCGCRGARLCLGGVWPVPGKVACTSDMGAGGGPPPVREWNLCPKLHGLGV